MTASDIEGAPETTAAMSYERASEIVQAINARSFVSMGFEQRMGSLEGVTLAQMVEARRIVIEHNEAAIAAAHAAGTGYSIEVIPADRLIAAVYTLHHYQPSNEPVLCLPIGWSLDSHIALSVVALTPEKEEADG